MGAKKVEWECLEQDPIAFGFRKGGIYHNFITSPIAKPEKGKMYLINDNGAAQIVNTKYFKKL